MVKDEGRQRVQSSLIKQGTIAVPPKKCKIQGMKEVEGEKRQYVPSVAQGIAATSSIDHKTKKQTGRKYQSRKVMSL